MDPRVKKVLESMDIDGKCEEIYYGSWHREFERAIRKTDEVFGDDVVPLCGEFVDEYIGDGKYLNHCMSAEIGSFGDSDRIDWSVPSFDLFGNAGEKQGDIDKAMKKCIGDAIEWYPRVVMALPDVANKPMYRTYDYGRDFRADDPARYEQLVATLKDQIGKGHVRQATEEEYDTPVPQRKGTSWTDNELIDGFDRDTKVEAIATPESIDILPTFFVNAFYGGGSTGFEVKIKPGAKLPVIAFHHVDPDTGEKKVERYENKVVEFARGPSRRDRFLLGRE